MTMLRHTYLSFIVLLMMGLLMLQCKSDDQADDAEDSGPGTVDDTESGSEREDGSDTADDSKSDEDTSKTEDSGKDESTESEEDDDTETSDGTATDKEDDDSETADDEMQLVLMLDDFEDGDHQSLLGGNWYGYEDVDNGGASALTISRNEDDEIVMDGEGYESTASMTLSWEFDQGDYEWDPYVGWGLNCGDEVNPFDISSFGGITYVYKGDAHFIMIETLNVVDFDYYKVQVKASTDWRRIDIPFSHFAQEGWGEVQDFALDNVHNIAFQAKGSTGETGMISIDDLGFLGAEVLDKEKDLKIQDPDVPEKKTIADVTIDNPLQALAMETLNKGANITNWLEQGKFKSFEYDEDYIKGLAANGYKALRLPIDLDLYIVDRDEVLDGDADFEVEPGLFEILDAFEEWTADAGMSLTIDFHQYDETLDIDDAIYVDVAAQLWKAVAEHFAPNTREDIFYELMNEPELSAGVSQVDQDDYTDFTQQIIDAIREVDTFHVIIFGDVLWNSRNMLTHREPFDDKRMIYNFHFYEPFEFTHQGASWAGLGTTKHLPWPYSEDRWSEYSMDFGYLPTVDSWHFDNLKKYYRQANANWLYNEIVNVKTWAIENNVPVICNEFGVYEKAAFPEDVVRYYEDLIGTFEELEIPWQVWFMLMDATTYEMDADKMAAMGLEATDVEDTETTDTDTIADSDSNTGDDSDTLDDTDSDTDTTHQ